MIPKFRAWDTFKQKWVKHFYITENGLIYNMEQQHRDLIGAVPIEKSGLILMQSTGLFDKSGVEIFEGDFLKNKDKPDTILICEKSDLQASFRARSTNGMISLALWHEESRDWTVIGNIHEQPDLVEVTT